MNYDYFTKTIQERGKQYFQQNRVFSIDQKNNKYSALILGTEPYHVVLTLDANDNITKASCNCPYARDGYRCKHEAALYYALEERLLKNNSQFMDVKQIYKKCRRVAYNDFTLNAKFMKEFKDYINIITMLNKTNILDITNYQKVLDDLVQLTYPNGYKNSLYNKAFQTYTKLMKPDNKTKTIEWLKQCLVSPEYKAYRKYLMDILDSFEVDEQIDILKAVLLKKKDNDLIDDYFDIVEKNDLDITDSLKELTVYSDNERYNYCLLWNLVKNNKKEEAVQKYQQLKKKRMIKNEYYQAKLDSLLIKGKEDSYFQYILQVLKISDEEEIILLYEDLEKFYGQNWYQYQSQFIDCLKTLCDIYGFYHILASQNDMKTFVYELMNDLEFDIFEAYQEKIKQFDEESYVFLYVYCLLEKVQYIKSAKDYNEFSYYIQKLLDYVDNQYIKQEIAQLFIEKYPKRKKIKEIFDECLSLEGEEYEYRY